MHALNNTLFSKLIALLQKIEYEKNEAENLGEQ
jgi:hypothetical protein